MSQRDPSCYVRQRAASATSLEPRASFVTHLTTAGLISAWFMPQKPARLDLDEVVQEMTPKQ